MVIQFLIEKEFKQMMRNIILPIVFILLPIGMINVMPRAATQEVKDLKISVMADTEARGFLLLHAYRRVLHLQGRTEGNGGSGG